MASKVQILKQIREEWTRETGSDPGKAGAEVKLDQMLAAFNEQIAAVGMVYAVRSQPYAAEYMRNWWVGAEYPEGKELREVLKRLEAGEALADDAKVLELKAVEPEEFDEQAAELDAHQAATGDPMSSPSDEVDPAATPAGIAPDGLGDEPPVFATEDGVAVAPKPKAARKPRVRKTPLKKSVDCSLCGEPAGAEDSTDFVKDGEATVAHQSCIDELASV